MADFKLRLFNRFETDLTNDFKLIHDEYFKMARKLRDPLDSEDQWEEMEKFKAENFI